MKKLFGLLALVLAVVSCQNDFEGTKIGGDEVAVTLNVAVPDDATRAAGEDSALSGLQNIDLQNDYDIRYILEVYDKDGELAKGPIVKCENDSASTSFDLRLVPGRDYRFVVWADFVLQGSEEDLHYYTEGGLQNISLLGDQKANDESRDAYTCVRLVEGFESGAPIEIELKRPFAKLRVVTTDMKELYSDLTSVTVAYTTPLYTTFNALTEEKGGLESVANTTKVVDLTNLDYVYVEQEYKDAGKMTLFADYFFGAEDDAIHFTLDATDATGMDIPEVYFNTNIPVQRNYLTTVMGPVLTDAANVTVKIEDAFENDGHFEDAPYYQVAVSNGFELVKALYEGREIIVLNNITVTAADVEAYLATTRTNTAINPVINLNGFTITIENNGNDALVYLNGGALTVEGNGAIVSTAGALVEGTTVVTEGAAVDAEAAVDENGASAVKTGLDALVYICKNGGEFNFTKDLEAAEVIFIETTNPIVINGNNKTITSSASRVFRIIAKANVTINNLNIVSTTALGSYDSVRGISMDGNIDDIVLTLNNCSVDFTADTAHDWSYAINKVGETSKNVQITINGGTYEGANVVNIWGNENIITINGATLNNLYRANESYCGCCIRLEGSGNIVNIDNTTFTGAHAVVVNEKTPGANTVNYGENNNTENLKRYCFKAGSELYYTLKDAVAATTEGEIKVLASVEMTEKVTIAAGKKITLDLSECTLSGKTFGNTNPQDLFLVNGELTVKDGTITAEHVGENMGWNGQGTIFNITAGGVVNLNGVTAKNLGGTDMGFVAHLNNWGEVTLNVENSTLEANYVAVRVFNSGNDMNNVTIKNSTLKGGNYAFWVHNYTVADFGTEAKAEAHKALLNFDIFDGTNTFLGKNDTPIRYGMTNAIYTAPGAAIVSSAEELIAALKDANVNAIVLGNDITVTEKWDNRYTGAKTTKAITIDGNGNTLKFACEVSDGFNYQAAFRFEAAAVVKNLTIDMSEVPGTGTWLRAISTKGDITVDNCTFIGNVNYTSGRGIAYGEGAGVAASEVVVSVSNSTFTNWTRRGLTDNENAQDAKDVTVVNNTFTNADAYVSAHDSIVFTGNAMNNSAANFRTYSNATDATVVATGNTLDTNNENNVIRGFVAANVESQEGFTIL